MKRYVVRLLDEERKVLEDLVSKGKSAAHKIKHANILLSSDANGACLKDEEIARLFHCHTNTVCNVRERFVTKGFLSALERKKRETAPCEKILDGKKEAHLIALCCSKAPEGNARWTLRLLADKLIELKIVEKISRETIRRTLKKMS